jgi:transcriptional regulator with XRE-family HTH domain
MNLVRTVRESKRLLKKDVLAQAGGIMTAHRLNRIESGTGRPPKADERAALAHVLNMPESGLFPEP